MTDANVLVETIAKTMFLTEHPTKQEIHWQRLAEFRKDGYREKVETVLMATMNAGFAIHEAGACIMAKMTTSLTPRPDGVQAEHEVTR